VTEANAKVAQSLFQMATQGKNVAAAIFWMKACAGWREKIEVRPVIDEISQMTDEELEAEIDRLERERQMGRDRSIVVQIVDDQQGKG